MFTRDEIAALLRMKKTSLDVKIWEASPAIEPTVVLPGKNRMSTFYYDEAAFRAIVSLFKPKEKKSC